MPGQQQTLQLIRQITSDGLVTFAELTTLASFLNENREARKNWPGSALFEVLKDILQDGRIDPCELDGLNLILEGIEIICAGNIEGGEAKSAKPASAPEEPKSAIVDEPSGEVDRQDADSSVIIDVPVAKDLILPELVASEITRRHDGACLTDYTCDCEDWRKVRKHLSANSPGRACKCIVSALADEIADSDKVKTRFGEVFTEVIRVANSSGRGLEAVETWKFVELGNKKLVISKGKTAWCNLYATGFEGVMEKFSYNRGYKRWGFGAFPKDQDLIKGFFDTGFKQIFGAENS